MSSCCAATGASAVWAVCRTSSTCGTGSVVITLKPTVTGGKSYCASKAAVQALAGVCVRTRQERRDEWSARLLPQEQDRLHRPRRGVAGMRLRHVWRAPRGHARNVRRAAGARPRGGTGPCPRSPGRRAWGSSPAPPGLPAEPGFVVWKSAVCGAARRVKAPHWRHQLQLAEQLREIPQIIPGFASPGRSLFTTARSGFGQW